MKIMILVFMLINLFVSVSYANSDVSSSVTKEIKFQAVLSDQILVSKIDGTSWYDDIQYLHAEDIKGEKWSSTPLEIRVRTRSAEKFSIDLVSALELTSIDGGKMTNVDVMFAGNYLQKQNILQPSYVIKHENLENRDSVYKLQVKTNGALDSDNNPTDIGVYSGSAILMFLPVL